jgi:cell wall-associated NlpC family hydrolase
MPILPRIHTSHTRLLKLAVRTAVAGATVVAGGSLRATWADAATGPPPSPGLVTAGSSTTTSSTTTAPVPVTLTPDQVKQMSALQVQITTTGALLDQLAETYETDTTQLATLQEREASIHADVVATQQELAVTRVRLRSDALTAYMAGVPLTDITTVPFSSSNAAEATSEYEQVAIANTDAVASDYESEAHALSVADTSLLATETKIQADITEITKARQTAMAAASQQQASLAALSTGNDGAAPAYLAAQSAGGNAVVADKSTPGLAAALSAAIWAAASQVGVPYVWGGETPLPAPDAGFDCSGLVQWAFGQVGIALPRTAQEQHDAVTPVPAAQVQPGDLVFWNDGTTSVQHVAIYVGAGIVLEAPSTGAVVSYSPLWPGGLVGFGVPTVPSP